MSLLDSLKTDLAVADSTAAPEQTDARPTHRMVSSTQATFVVAVNNREILNRNFLASPCLLDCQKHQVIFQEGFSSAASAYNDAIDKSENDLIIFCHQDMFFPRGWMSQVQAAINYLDATGDKWGVLGCSGITADGKMHGHVYSSGLGIIGEPSGPEPIQTLDEIVLILRKSSGLRFDETLPHFHLYGTDICLRAAAGGMTNYAISAFCIHNTQPDWILPKEFYRCCRHVKRVWRDHLPIQTTCTRITRFNGPLYLRMLQGFYCAHIRRKKITGKRVDDLNLVLNEVADLL